MRGEVWTVCASGYASKPRPAVIVQSNNLQNFDSTIICLFTTDESIEGSTRVRVTATETNRLSRDCILMAEKPVAVRRSALGKKLGVLEGDTLARIDNALRSALELE